MAMRVRQAIIRICICLSVFVIMYNLLTNKMSTTPRRLLSNNLEKQRRQSSKSTLNSYLYGRPSRVLNSTLDVHPYNTNPANTAKDCTIKLVVRGHDVFFSDVKTKDRVTWCPRVERNVSVVYSRNLSVILSANITLFSHLMHVPPRDDIHYLVENRRLDQRWALMSLEAPLRVARNTSLPHAFSGQFYNWLATYNPASDIPIPYGQMIPLTDRDRRPPIGNPFRERPKLIAFVSSNCNHSKWRRLEFVQAMQSYLPVDIYGKCGNLTCGVDDNCTDILRQYKFILALENSPCPGYISEKFWEAISNFGSVAVVFGADKKDYDSFTPPGSHINIESFQSIKTLAAFLIKVSLDEGLYNRYHRWRRYFRVTHQDKWWNLPDNGQVCHAAERYLEEIHSNRQPTYRNTNSWDWIRSCRIPPHTKMEAFPIPVDIPVENANRE